MTQNGAQAQQTSGHPRRWAIMASVGLGTVMATLDSSVVNIAMPTITETFGTVLAVSQWVAAAYLLAISSLLLTYGRAGDMFGHKKVYLTGFAVFTASSALCGFAPSIAALIAFRVLQALGAGMLMASGPAIITAAFPPTERGKALGLNGTIVGSGLAIGPVLGGFLVEMLGWRSVFFINLPIGIAGLVWASKVLPSHVRQAGAVARRFDLAGAATACMALVAWLLALSKGSAWGWGSPVTVALWIAGALSLAGFFKIESATADPLVDLSLLSVPSFVFANATALLNFMAQFSIVFLTPFYLQQVLHLPPDRAGSVLLTSPLVVMAVAPVAGSLSDRIGPTFLAPAGMSLVSGALFAMSRLHPSSSIADVTWRLALMGLGSAMFQSPNNSVIMGSVPKSRLGLASGMLATVRNVGMVMGISVSTAVFTARHSHYLAQAANDAARAAYGRPEAYMAALSDAFTVGAVLAVIGVATAMVGGRRRP